MFDFNEEEFEKKKDIVTNGNIAMLTERIKEMPFYPMYIEKVKKGEGADKTEELLTIMTGLISLGDKDLGLLITTVATNMLFAALNLRLRSELGEVD